MSLFLLPFGEGPVGGHHRSGPFIVYGRKGIFECSDHVSVSGWIGIKDKIDGKDFLLCHGCKLLEFIGIDGARINGLSIEYHFAYRGSVSDMSATLVKYLHAVLVPLKLLCHYLMPTLFHQVEALLGFGYGLRDILLVLEVEADGLNDSQKSNAVSILEYSLVLWMRFDSCNHGVSALAQGEGVHLLHILGEMRLLQHDLLHPQFPLVLLRRILARDSIVVWSCWINNSWIRQGLH